MVEKIVNFIRGIFALFLIGFLIWGFTSDQLGQDPYFFQKWVGLIVIFLILNLFSKKWRKQVSAQYKKGQVAYNDTVANPN